MEKTKPIPLCRLYVNKSAAGAEYLAGNLGGARVLGFLKTGDDGTKFYSLSIVERKEKREDQASRSSEIKDSIPF